MERGNGKLSRRELEKTIEMAAKMSQRKGTGRYVEGDEFTTEDYFSIGKEAGIPREHLERALRARRDNSVRTAGARRNTIWVVLVVAAIAFILIASFFSARNRFVSMEEDTRSRWAQVENQLRRRSDLIPNLVSTVQGYAKQEREIFENIANARARLAGAKDIGEKIDASNELSGALSRLLVITENYPQLKSDAAFTRLMDELSGTENRISVERMRYNEAVQGYNTQLRRFPGSVVASLSGFKRAVYYEVPEAAKEPPKVEFK
jgi:LemA protein